MPFITRHARIRNYALYAQHELLFRNEGNLDLFLDQAMKSMAVSYPKFYRMDRLSKLGILATEALLTGVQLVANHGAEGVALVLANNHASLDTDLRYFESTRTIASPALFVYTLTNIVSGEICIRHGIKGENAFFVMPAFDPMMLSGYVEMVMASQKTKACIAGWIDVMGEEHDVFLYLAEKRGDNESLAHSSEVLRKLYTA